MDDITKRRPTLTDRQRRDRIDEVRNKMPITAGEVADAMHEYLASECGCLLCVSYREWICRGRLA